MKSWKSWYDWGLLKVCTVLNGDLLVLVVDRKVGLETNHRVLSRLYLGSSYQLVNILRVWLGLEDCSWGTGGYLAKLQLGGVQGCPLRGHFGQELAGGS